MKITIIINESYLESFAHFRDEGSYISDVFLLELTMGLDQLLGNSPINENYFWKLSWKFGIAIPTRISGIESRVGSYHTLIILVLSKKSQLAFSLIACK